MEDFISVLVGSLNIKASQQNSKRTLLVFAVTKPLSWDKVLNSDVHVSDSYFDIVHNFELEVVKVRLLDVRLVLHDGILDYLLELAGQILGRVNVLEFPVLTHLRCQQ